ncbi:hypothetical protein BSU04_24520 [Caballeronia sordidicola]|uniref:Uncharacterized protein n=1 Tax=Caballeronia sordidicola TaxID=196367 RepID=A0A226WXJ1_CABSO|nr:hypothetical protein BSU04_24520 [Caballeronia sordidicola]
MLHGRATYASRNTKRVDNAARRDLIHPFFLPHAIKLK